MSLDKKLSDLPLETAVTGDHQLYLTNGGQSKRALVSALPIAAEAIAAKDAAEAAAAAEQAAAQAAAAAACWSTAVMGSSTMQWRHVMAVLAFLLFICMVFVAIAWRRQLHAHS